VDHTSDGFAASYSGMRRLCRSSRFIQPGPAEQSVRTYQEEIAGPESRKTNHCES